MPSNRRKKKKGVRPATAVAAVRENNDGKNSQSQKSEDASLEVASSSSRSSIQVQQEEDDAKVHRPPNGSDHKNKINKKSGTSTTLSLPLPLSSSSSSSSSLSIGSNNTTSSVVSTSPSASSTSNLSKVSSSGSGALVKKKKVSPLVAKIIAFGRKQDQLEAAEMERRRRTRSTTTPTPTSTTTNSSSMNPTPSITSTSSTNTMTTSTTTTARRTHRKKVNPLVRQIIEYGRQQDALDAEAKRLADTLLQTTTSVTNNTNPVTSTSTAPAKKVRRRKVNPLVRQIIEFGRRQDAAEAAAVTANQAPASTPTSTTSSTPPANTNIAVTKTAAAATSPPPLAREPSRGKRTVRQIVDSNRPHDYQSSSHHSAVATPSSATAAILTPLSPQLSPPSRVCSAPPSTSSIDDQVAVVREKIVVHRLHAIHSEHQIQRRLSGACTPPMQSPPRSPRISPPTSPSSHPIGIDATLHSINTAITPASSAGGGGGGTSSQSNSSKGTPSKHNRTPSAGRGSRTFEHGSLLIPPSSASTSANVSPARSPLHSPHSPRSPISGSERDDTLMFGYGSGNNGGDVRINGRRAAIAPRAPLPLSFLPHPIISTTVSSSGGATIHSARPADSSVSPLMTPLGGIPSSMSHPGMLRRSSMDSIVTHTSTSQLLQLPSLQQSSTSGVPPPFGRSVSLSPRREIALQQHHHQHSPGRPPLPAPLERITGQRSHHHGHGHGAANGLLSLQIRKEFSEDEQSDHSNSDAHSHHHSHGNRSGPPSTSNSNTSTVRPHTAPTTSIESFGGGGSDRGSGSSRRYENSSRDTRHDRRDSYDSHDDISPPSTPDHKPNKNNRKHADEQGNHNNPGDNHSEDDDDHDDSSTARRLAVRRPKSAIGMRPTPMVHRMRKAGGSRLGHHHGTLSASHSIALTMVGGVGKAIPRSPLRNDTNRSTTSRGKTFDFSQPLLSPTKEQTNNNDLPIITPESLVIPPFRGKRSVTPAQPLPTMSPTRATDGKKTSQKGSNKGSNDRTITPISDGNNSNSPHTSAPSSPSSSVDHSPPHVSTTLTSSSTTVLSNDVPSPRGDQLRPLTRNRARYNSAPHPITLPPPTSTSTDPNTTAVLPSTTPGTDSEKKIKTERPKSESAAPAKTAQSSPNWKVK
jgi:hypothetical protein